MMRLLYAALGILWPTVSHATSEVVRSFDLGTPLYHAGSLAVAAYPRWETVVMGPIPAVVGAVRYGAKGPAKVEPAFKVVAVVSQDTLAHRLMVSNDEYDTIAKDPAKLLPGRAIALTPQSTAQIYAQQCLAGWGLALDQMLVVEGEQAEIRRAISDNAADVALVWSPTTYHLAADKAKAKALTCPDMRALDVPALIVARADLLTESDPVRLSANRKKVAAVVAAHLGAWARTTARPADAAARLAKVYAEQKITVTEAQARAELEARRPGGLAEQRVAFRAPAGGTAPLGATLEAIMKFMIETGTLRPEDKPIVADLLDPSILELIASDQDLRLIAAGGTLK